MALVQKDPTAKTIGLSPKVAWPAVALAALGVVAIILHFVLDDTDNWLLHIGLGLVGASGLASGIGFGAPPSLQSQRVVDTAPRA
jgi:hypothetical protein